MNGESGGSSESGGGANKPVSAKNGVENIGAAVFKGDKLVGRLNAEETLAHLLLTKELKSCNITIPSPEDENKKIDLYLTSNYASTIDVSIVNGNPYIKANITISSKISSIDDMSKEVNEERTKQIEESASNYLKNLLSDYLYKTSKEFHSDIAGFGKYALKDFKTMNEFEEYDWLNRYQDASFEVNTKVAIKSGFLLTET